MRHRSTVKGYYFEDSQVPTLDNERTDSKHDDTDLVERAVRNARNYHPCPMMPRWHAVKTVFGCGSTRALELCKRFNLNPDDELPTVFQNEGEDED